jgi:hypothetical protein
MLMSRVTVFLLIYIFTCKNSLIFKVGVRGGPDLMIVGFITAYAISATI